MTRRAGARVRTMRSARTTTFSCTQRHTKRTMPLIRTPNIPDPDGFYEALIDSQRALDDAQAEAMNARLILILANHIGDRDVFEEALRVARDSQRC
jgi:hypothetical protein